MILLQIAPLPIPASPSEREAEALAVAIIGVTVLTLLAFLAAGMTFLSRYRGAEAATLQARVAEAIAADVDCARVGVVRVTGPTALMPASVTLEGIVVSPAVRARAIRLAGAAARRVDPQAAVIDHLIVKGDRAA
jgi:hypothetical protein